MHRRQFLRGAAALGGAVALGSRYRAQASSARSPSTAVSPLTADSILTGSAAECPVDTLLVITMENRSFDHYFGWLASDATYLESGLSRYGSGFSVDGRQDLVYTRPDGSAAPTYYLPDRESDVAAYRGCGHPDPNHGWAGGRAQRDGGFVGPGSGNDDYAIGYYLEGDLPCYSQLARNATIFDHYHASLMASTYPNREYLHSAQSGGHIDNALPISDLGFKWETIWDRLMAANVPATLYSTDIPTTLLWGARMLPVTRPIVQYFVDAAAGTLPNVTFVDPGFLGGMRTDDHPEGDMRMGQRFVASIIDAFQRSPQWGNGAVIVTYDEWGGFFDHVPPPVLGDDRASTEDDQNFGQAGFRLPVILHSPYARPGYVDHRVYDHTSVLRFIEWRFLGAPPEGPSGAGWWLTSRDRNAANIGAALVNERVNDFVMDSAAVPYVVSTPCQGDAFQDVPGLDTVEKELTPTLTQLGVNLDTLATSVQVMVPPEPSMADAAESGYLESVGWDATPSLTIQQLLDP